MAAAAASATIHQHQQSRPYHQMSNEEFEAVDLRGCPFCGSKAEMRKQDIPAGSGPFYWAKCTSRDCAVSTMSCKTEQEAGRLWNRRA